MYAGGSGEFSITHVKFMVDPLSIYKSGAPIISVDGSIHEKKKKYMYIIQQYFLYICFDISYFG